MSSIKNKFFCPITRGECDCHCKLGYFDETQTFQCKFLKLIDKLLERSEMSEKKKCFCGENAAFGTQNNYNNKQVYICLYHYWLFKELKNGELVEL